MDRMKLLLLIVLLANMLVAQTENNAYFSNWPMWRGPAKTGEAFFVKPPVEWSESSNIKWKIQIPEKGLSTPIVWEDQIFITSAVSLDADTLQKLIQEHMEGYPQWQTKTQYSSTAKHLQQFILFSFSKDTGDILWFKIVNTKVPHEGTHADGSYASSSCTTDGKNLIVSFGSFGIFCFDMQGKQIWSRNLGDMKTYESFGEGISPVLYKDRVIINWDHEGESFITTLDAKTGETIWKTERDEHTTWATPIVIEADGKNQVVVSGNTACISYNVTDGKEIWRVGGLTMAIVPCPVYADNMVYFMSGYPKYACLAVNIANAKGDLTGSPAVVWTKDDFASYVPSPLLYDGKLYYLASNKGLLTCVEAATGNIFYQTQKLDKIKGVYASPVAANGLIYVLGRNGVCYVIQADNTYKQIAINSLDDKFDASPAFVGNDLILRGTNFLYCISSP